MPLLVAPSPQQIVCPKREQRADASPSPFYPTAFTVQSHFAVFSHTPITYREVLALAHRRDKTELLEHAEPVIEPPVFHDLAGCHACDFDGRDRHLLARWGDTPKCSLLCSMGRKPDDHLVPFRDHALNGDVQIKETRQGHGDGLFGSLGTDGETSRECVIDVVGGDEVINGGQIPLVEHFLIEMANKGLVIRLWWKSSHL